MSVTSRPLPSLARGGGGGEGRLGAGDDWHFRLSSFLVCEATKHVAWRPNAALILNVAWQSESPNYRRVFGTNLTTWNTLEKSLSNGFSKNEAGGKGMIHDKKTWKKKVQKENTGITRTHTFISWCATQSQGSYLIARGPILEPKSINKRAEI